MMWFKIELCNGSKCVMYPDKITHLVEVDNRTIIHFGDKSSVGVYMDISSVRSLIDICRSSQHLNEVIF